MAEKPLRLAMPTVAAWIDDLRAAFGAESINAAIRNGANGGTHFHARENGHEIGVEPDPAVRIVSVAQMVLRQPGDGGA